MIKIIIETTYENLTKVIDATINPKIALKLLSGIEDLTNRVGETRFDENQGLMVRVIDQNIWLETVIAEILTPGDNYNEVRHYSYKIWDEMREADPELYELAND